MSDINLSFTRNLKAVSWGGTVRLNLSRALGAGVVWAIFAFGLAAPWKIVVAIVLLCPIAHLVVGIPVGIAAHALAEFGFPLGGAFGFLIAVLMLPGDPLVYLTCRAFPRAFSLQGGRLFQVTPVLLVTRVAKLGSEATNYEVSSISGA